jgi:endonuclease/exonuclease/phosphatase family metal-dependent hydrolase
MNRFHFFFLALSMMGLATCSEAQPSSTASALIAFYNVENLFDTNDDPKIDDADFLPKGKLKWTQQRYSVKLNNIAKVILAIGDGNGPEIIGLCEVENRRVLEDLTHKTILVKQQYGIQHYDSPDGRGIDVALLYKLNAFLVLESKSFVAPQISDTIPPTRSILYVKGILKGRDTLCLFINHWPSRRGGTSDSEPRRIIMAQFLKQISDSVAKVNPSAQLIAMGDFNDEPSDKSLKVISHISSDNKIPGFVNMMITDLLKGKGTHYYRSEKLIFDQFLVSKNLFVRQGFYVTENSAQIFQPDWIMDKIDKSNIPSPLRTYAGNRYIGGYSDHLPVVLKIYFR